MSLLWKIKDLVIVDESENKEESRANDVGESNSSNGAPPFQGGAPTAAGSDAKADDSTDLEKQIDAQIQNDALFAPFRAFIRMSENMKAKVPDEAQRYQAMQAATEVSPDALLKALNAHAIVLKRESVNFTARWSQRRRAKSPPSRIRRSNWVSRSPRCRRNCPG